MEFESFSATTEHNWRYYKVTSKTKQKIGNYLTNPNVRFVENWYILPGMENYLKSSNDLHLVGSGAKSNYAHSGEIVFQKLFILKQIKFCHVIG